jgi:hypothetical protein
MFISVLVARRNFWATRAPTFVFTEGILVFSSFRDQTEHFLPGAFARFVLKPVTRVPAAKSNFGAGTGT